MAVVRGVGKYLPERIVANDDLAAYMDTSDEWITQRSGIRQRRWVRDGNREEQEGGNALLAASAARAALFDAGLEAESVDAVFYATISPDTEFPGSGGAFLSRLGISRGIPFFEVRNQCTGFLYALTLGNAYIESEACRNVLVVGSEVQSNGLLLSDEGRNTAVLFGDGSGAVVLTPTGDRAHGIQASILGSDGAYADKLGLAAPGFARSARYSPADFEGNEPAAFPRMDGKFVFKMASVKMPEMVRAVAEKAGVTVSDIDLIVPHQANQRILDALGHELGCPEKVFSNIAHYGNTTAATIPIALTEAVERGLVQPGGLICLVSFGAGFSWGAVLIRWVA